MSHVHHSHPELIIGDRIECLLEVHKAHRPIEWLLVLACFVHQYSEIQDLVSCSPSLSKSRLFVCNFCFGLHMDPFQYDRKKYLTVMWDKSNCFVIYTLFKITFLGKWDECVERPFLWPLTSFPDRDTYSVHSASTVLLGPHQDSGPVALRLAVWRMARATSERSGRGSYSQYSCSECHIV